MHIHHITQIWTSWCNYKSMNELHQFIILIISHYVVFIYIHVISFVILYSIFFFVNKSVYLINSSFSLANCSFKKIKYSLQFVSKHCIVKYIGQKCQTFVRATKWIFETIVWRIYSRTRVQVFCLTEIPSWASVLRFRYIRYGGIQFYVNCIQTV